MSRLPRVIAVGVADAHEVVGTSGVRAAWRDISNRPLGSGRSYRELFGLEDDTYRRLDNQTKALVMAAAATGIDRLLGADEREDAALVTETTCGGLDVDLRFTGALADGIVHGAIFPYSLQSTCLGDVALRHGLRGPTVCLSVDPASRGEALREAARMIAAGEIRHAVVGAVDALERPLPGIDASLRAVIAVVEGPHGGSAIARPAVAEWPQLRGDEPSDPFEAWADACRARVAR